MVLNEILLWVVIVDMVNGTIGGSIQVLRYIQVLLVWWLTSGVNIVKIV